MFMGLITDFSAFTPALAYRHDVFGMIADTVMRGAVYRMEGALMRGHALLPTLLIGAALVVAWLLFRSAR
jgi:hypothetical protein